MKASLSRQAGGPETLVLEDVPETAAGPNQVKIAVRTCGVNFPDLLIIQDRYQYKPPRPFIPGGEIAGVVEAMGERVDKIRPGARTHGIEGCSRARCLACARIGSESLAAAVEDPLGSFASFTRKVTQVALLGSATRVVTYDARMRAAALHAGLKTLDLQGSA
jgi:NADPH:quinone reductase-like Zn-dependent oxidoreductase